MGANYAERDYFVNALDSGVFQGLEVSKAGTNHFFTISHPLDSPTDKTHQGVIIIRIRSAHALEPFHIIAPQIGEGGEVVMIDSGANIFTAMSQRDGNYTPRDMFRKIAPTTPGSISAIMRLDGEMDARDYRDETVLAAYRYIALNKDYGFGLVVKKDASAVTAEIRRIFIPLLLADVVFFVILSALIYAVSQKFTAPIEKLSEVAEELGAGDLTVRARSEGVAESRLLADSFNKMAERIETRERNLQESERYFRTLFNTISDIAIAHEFPMGKIFDVNDTAVKTLGYSREEFLKITVNDIDDPTFKEDPTRLDEILEMIKGGKTVIFRRKAKKSNGESIPVEIHSCLFEYRGREAVLSIARDITERLEAESALKAEKRLAEEATALKDKYISLVSHDLKNPLHVILGTIRLIMKDTSGHPNPRIGLMLDAAFGSCMKMLQLINDVLNISRFKIGKTPVNFKFFDAKAIAANAVNNFESEAEQKGVRLVNNVPEKTRIFTDVSLYTEVIGNLVANAIKFCDASGTVTLFIPGGRPTTIAVKDTGVGIPRETLDKLFKYEERISTIGTYGEKGSGFGLPLSSDIMKTLGGSLTVESEPGRGSVFFAELPAVTPRMLIVDDDPNMRLALRGYLKPLKIEITEAKNGKEALSVIQKWKPHIMILDLAMPVMDGFTTLEALKKGNWLEKMTALVITGDTNMETRNRIFELGAHDYIEKTVTADNLLPRVRRFVV